MRYTAPNSDIREVPAGEVWVGIADEEVVIATRSRHEDNLVLVCRLKPAEASQMGGELIQLALTATAPNN